MGQAKQRGTFEQRQRESMERQTVRQEREQIRLAEQRERQRQYDLAHPEQAAARRRTIYRTNSILALAAGISMGAMNIARGSTTKR